MNYQIPTELAQFSEETLIWAVPRWADNRIRNSKRYDGIFDFYPLFTYVEYLRYIHTRDTK